MWAGSPDPAGEPGLPSEKNAGMEKTVADLRALGSSVVEIRCGEMAMRGRFLVDRLTDDSIMALFETESPNEGQVVVPLHAITEITTR